MGKIEDSDIKIFEPKIKEKNKDDIVTIVEETLHQRQNGNSGKAKQLGKELALAYEDTDSTTRLMDKYGLDIKYLKQVFALVQFSTEAALSFYLPSTLLSNIAVVAMQDKLIKIKHSLYEDVLNGSDFSFYYLSVRKGGDNIPYDIGKAFAMLCSKENDDFYINKGKDIYLETLSQVQENIDNFNFTIG